MIVELLARWLYRRCFARFGPAPAWMPTWAGQSDDVKESWRREARAKIYFWRRPA